MCLDKRIGCSTSPVGGCIAAWCATNECTPQPNSEQQMFVRTQNGRTALGAGINKHGLAFIEFLKYSKSCVLNGRG